ncbi:hypothetical protein AVEN_92565-1 [Araneus ventricosus]|uniref:Endonuclease/exonuclease/phosphatase domain-containing protein n=1 Tax=Araneus ventricosus TaxID=182803 RepID=A0A4Y2AHS6_ARAVE|nr:hypothetical protein AVEN_92565-1 [Araneus ventricosus]
MVYKKLHYIIVLASEEFGDASVERIPLPPSADLCYRARRGRFVLPYQEFRMASAETGTRTAYFRHLYSFIHDLDIGNYIYSAPICESEWDKSWIDLTLSKNISRENLKNWTVQQEVTASDHDLITYEISYEKIKSVITKH